MLKTRKIQKKTRRPGGLKFEYDGPPGSFCTRPLQKKPVKKTKLLMRISTYPIITRNGNPKRLKCKYSSIYVTGIIKENTVVASYMMLKTRFATFNGTISIIIPLSVPRMKMIIQILEKCRKTPFYNRWDTFEKTIHPEPILKTVYQGKHILEDRKPYKSEKKMKENVNSRKNPDDRTNNIRNGKNMENP